jgi:predicted enzyme related to lactoylglutathione lyase
MILARRRVYAREVNPRRNEMSDRKLIPGKFVWFEHVSKDAKKAQAFYAEVLGWKVQRFPMGDQSYEMIFVGENMIGGYSRPLSDRQPPHWISYVSVEDVDASAKAAAASGGKVVQAPYDIPTVGRTARIADPQGAEICPFKSNNGDPPDGEVTNGNWLWNELHTNDVAKALGFYEKVIGFSHRSVEMGPAGTYHILSKGGVDRGGATSYLQSGVPPHWLPYVFVDDVDAAIARAKRQGATIPMNAEDIPGVGRIGVLKDPTGAALAVMKPLPRQ